MGKSGSHAEREGGGRRVLTTILFLFFVRSDKRWLDCALFLKIYSPSISFHSRAFTIFCEEPKHPDVSPAVALLRRLPLRPGGLDVFTRRDPLGSGFICRVDLFDGLRELGVMGTPPKQARNKY